MSLKLTDGCLSFANSIAREISFTEENLPKYFTRFDAPVLSAGAEMTFECELGPGAAKIFGIDFANGQDVTATNVIFKSPRQTQIRRHKKKRINKKWNKKFGPRYITTFEVRELKGVRFNQTGSELTIVGERSRMITPYDALYI